MVGPRQFELREFEAALEAFQRARGDGQPFIELDHHVIRGAALAFAKVSCRALKRRNCLFELLDMFLQLHASWAACIHKLDQFLKPLSFNEDRVEVNNLVLLFDTNYSRENGDTREAQGISTALRAQKNRDNKMGVERACDQDAR